MKRTFRKASSASSFVFATMTMGASRESLQAMWKGASPFAPSISVVRTGFIRFTTSCLAVFGNAHIRCLWGGGISIDNFGTTLLGPFFYQNLRLKSCEHTLGHDRKCLF